MSLPKQDDWNLVRNVTTKPIFVVGNQNNSLFHPVTCFHSGITAQALR